MSSLAKILTKNDFIIKFDETTKMFKVVLMFGVKLPDPLRGNEPYPFGHLRVFKGIGKTIRIAMKNCIEEVKFSLKNVIDFY